MIEEAFEDFFMVTLPMPFRLRHVNVFLLIHGDEIALFDTGMNTQETFLILEKALQTINKNVKQIKQIFITHDHIDHCGMAGRIKEVSGAEIHMSKLSRPFTARSEREDFAARVQGFSLVHGLPRETIDSVISLFLKSGEDSSRFRIDQYFAPNQTLRIGNKRLQVIPTPGHTLDHVSFFFPEEKVLLAGDHILPEITPNLSPDFFSPDFFPLRSFLESLVRADRLPVAKVYPAHGRPFSSLTARIEELKTHHEVRKALTLQSVQTGPKQTFQISQDIFGSDLPEFDQYLALCETYVHLIELRSEGFLKERRVDGRILYGIAENN